MELTQTTQEGWASFLCQFQCYGTEPDALTMRHRHSVTQETLGEVHYHNGKDKTYYINQSATSPKIHGSTSLQTFLFTIKEPKKRPGCYRTYKGVISAVDVVDAQLLVKTSAKWHPKATFSIQELKRRTWHCIQVA